MKSVWLMYHDIYDGDLKGGVPRSAAIYHVSKENFVQHLSAIEASGRRVITIDEFLKGSSEDSVVLTFDDGWNGAFEIGLPLLQKAGWKATFFITRDLIGRKGFCDREMIVEAARAEMEIGVHGTTHRILSKCSREKITWEFSECKTFLESLLAKPTEFASLPGGDWTRTVVACGKKAGIKALCTSRPGINRASTFPFNLRRVAVRGSTRDSDIFGYCHYQLKREVARWALLRVPRRLGGVKNYGRLRRWFLGERESTAYEIFSH